MSTIVTIVSFILLIITGSIVSEARQCSSEDINELQKLTERKIEEVKKTCDRSFKELEQKFHLQMSKRSAAGGIAFSAQLSVQQTHVPIGTVIKFDKVFVNDGSGYDSQTGVFIAPEKGVYMLTYFIGNGNTVGQAWVGLMHNGNKVNSAVVDVFHHGEDAQGGNMALVRMEAGDRAWIELYEHANAYLDGPHGFNSFSGLYLYG